MYRYIAPSYTPTIKLLVSVRAKTKLRDEHILRFKP